MQPNKETRAELSVLERFAHEQARMAAERRPSLQMSCEGNSESYPAQIIGMQDRHLILSMPRATSGAYVAVQEKQTWIFRTLHYTTAVRFQAPVLKRMMEPFPHLHVGLPQTIERRVVRHAPRAVVSLTATLSLPSTAPAVITNLSIGGAQIAVNAGTPVELKQGASCEVVLPVNERPIAIELACTVLARDPDDPRYPDLTFYRLQFGTLSDVQMLALLAFVSTTLAAELDRFWRAISFESH
jgi:hypothetical protein